MENKSASAGNKGLRVKNDCCVYLELMEAGGNRLQIDSKVGILYGSTIEQLCRDILRYFGIQNASVKIEDTGAYDFVIAARLEAGTVCIQDTFLTLFKTYDVESNSFKFSGMGGSRTGPGSILRYFRKQSFLTNTGEPEAFV